MIFVYQIFDIRKLEFNRIFQGQIGVNNNYLKIRQIAELVERFNLSKRLYVIILYLIYNKSKANNIRLICRGNVINY